MADSRPSESCFSLHIHINGRYDVLIVLQDGLESGMKASEILAPAAGQVVGVWVSQTRGSGVGGRREKRGG